MKVSKPKRPGTRPPGRAPEVFSPHVKLTPPCRCGYPLMPSDQGVCPRCSAGVHWTAPAIKGEP